MVLFWGNRAPVEGQKKGNGRGWIEWDGEREGGKSCEVWALYRLKHSQLHLWAPQSPLHDQSTGYPIIPDGQNIRNQVRSSKINHFEVAQKKKMYMPCCNLQSDYNHFPILIIHNCGKVSSESACRKRSIMIQFEYAAFKAIAKCW